MTHEKVTLGAHEIDVFPQRHAYLTNKLAAFFSELAKSDVAMEDAAGIIGMLGDRAYDLLTVVLPQYAKRCPRYEFMGYSSQSQYEAGAYDENVDQSPSFPEMVEAFNVATRINRFDVLKVLTKVIDPKLLKGWINTQVALQISSASQSLPSEPDGVKESMSSGTTAPTSTGNGDLPSQESSLFPMPTNVAESVS